MDRLEQLLGKELKRSDFGIGADGTVSSGKPLTARRIKAILNKVNLQYAELNPNAPATKSAVSQNSEKDSEILYKDFKNVYTLGAGSIDPHYKDRGEFYKALSQKLGDKVSTLEGGQHQPMDFVKNLYSEVQSMADLDFLMKADNVTMQNFMQAHEGKVNLTNIELFYFLNTITADFESKFGPDAVKEMITKTGGKISDNSRPVIDLVNLVFSEKQDFNGSPSLFQQQIPNLVPLIRMT